MIEIVRAMWIASVAIVSLLPLFTIFLFVLCLSFFFIVTVICFAGVHNFFVVNIRRVAPLATGTQDEAGIDDLGFVLNVIYFNVSVLR